MNSTFSQSIARTNRSQEPPTSWPAETPLDEFVGQWWVAHVKPRQEKVLAHDILHSGGAYFLPMYEAMRRSRGRKWKSTLPLFPGYVFLCCHEENRLAALKTNRIVKMIPVPDQEQLVGELSSIKRLLDMGVAIDPHAELKKGVRCKIHSGPMQGLQGQVKRRKGRARFVVQVSILGQGASMEIDADLLEPIV